MTNTDHLTHPASPPPAAPGRGRPRPPLPPRAPGRVWLAALAVGAVVAILAYLLMPNKGQGPIELDGEPELARMVGDTIAGAESAPQALVVLDRGSGAETAEVDGGTADGSTPVDADTPFETGSVFKVLTAMTLADLVDSGETDLDRTVGEIYPEVDFADPGVADITLAELAAHHSGLPRVSAETYAGVAAQTFTQTNVYRSFPEAADSLAVAELATPGEYAYSNFGFAVLGEALARESGTPYPDLVRERVLDPVGMDDTFILGADTEEIPADAALPHVESGARVQLWNARHYAPAGIGTWSTANDLMRLATAVQEGSAPGMSALEMTRDIPESPEAAEGSIGLAWMTTEFGDAGEVVWHGGATNGSSAFVGFQDDRAVVAVGAASPFVLDVTVLGVSVLNDAESASEVSELLGGTMLMFLAQTLLMTLLPPVLALTLMARRKTLIGQRPLDKLRIISMPLGATAMLLVAQRAGSWAATPPALWALAVGCVAAALVVGVWLWPRAATVRARWRWLRIPVFGLSVAVSIMLGALAVWGLAAANLG